MSAEKFAEIALDVCTPEGRTWLARITGRDGRFGVEREFVNAAVSNLSRSGMTGWKSYEVPDGVYESNEGRRRLGRRYWIVKDGEAVEASRVEALKAL